MKEQLSSPAARRPYHSPARRKQAEDTRHRILEEARTLFRTVGYSRTTIDAVAQAAGVSPKTVTALFGSKRELLAALVEITEFGSTFQETRSKLGEDLTAERRINLIARMNRQAYETLTPEFDLLRGASAVASEIADVAHKIGERRRHHEGYLIQILGENKLLRHDLAPEDALDEMWALTSFDVYHALVIDRGWSPDRYESWLASMLVQRLLEPR